MLLSPLEKERLHNRKADFETKASNDAKMRRKLSEWLDDLAEVVLVIKYLPQDQLRRVFKDEHAFGLLTLAEKIMGDLEFMPIEGSVRVPEGWQVPSGDGKFRPATTQDWGRAKRLRPVLETLKDFYGSNNPVTDALDLEHLYKNPNTRDRLTPGEIVSVERVKEPESLEQGKV